MIAGRGRLDRIAGKITRYAGGANCIDRELEMTKHN